MSSFDLVLVGYRARDTAIALRFCDSMFGGLRIRRKILVLNQSIDAFSHPDGSWELVRGSNRLGEFSGWQEGLDFLVSGEALGKGVIFTNDTICTHRHFTHFRERAFLKSLRKAQDSSLIGFRDTAPSGSSILRLVVPSWVSTYCFGLTTPALDGLDRKLYDEFAINNCVPGGADETKFFANISSPLSEHLRWWLFNGGWYGAKPLTIQNSAKFERKAKCIIAEIMLSSRCLNLGVINYDPFLEHDGFARLDKLSQRMKRWSSQRFS